MRPRNYPQLHQNLHGNYLTVMADEHFAEVQRGGSLILAWQVRNKHVLVVGGGEVGFCAPTC